MTERSAGSIRLRGGLWIAVAMGLMNFATYGYTIAAAHLIGPTAFGAFSALMGVLLVVNVLSLGLQATGARRIAADPEHVATIERVILGASVRSAIVLGLLCLALAPVFNSVLRLESLPTAMLVAVAAAPLTMMGGQAGILQGEQRWEPLAMIYLSQGLGRVAGGLGLLYVWPTEFAAVLGVAIGAWIPVVVGYVALRKPRPGAAPDTGAGVQLLREVAGSSQALLAFFALSNADILLARALLDSELAGLYAGGLILVKAVLFLPQFVVVIAFPSMATKGAARGTMVKALGLALLLGMSGLVGTLLLPDLALIFVGGTSFAAIKGSLWLFAIVGTLLSMIQLLLYAALARQQWRTILLVWTTLAALLALAPTIDSGTGLVRLVATLDGALFLVLLVGILRSSPAPRAQVHSSVPGAA